MSFDLQNPNPMSILVSRDPKSSIIRKISILFLLLRISDTALGYPCVMLAIALSRRPKLSFGLEKLINSTLFAALGENILELISNALELISNRTEKLDFFILMQNPR